MFKITLGKGFHVTYDNGYTVSVQWGPGSYSDNRMADRPRADCGATGSATAEVAVMAPNKNDWEEVGGWKTPEEVAALMSDVAARDGGAA